MTIEDALEEMRKKEEQVKEQQRKEEERRKVEEQRLLDEERRARESELNKRLETRLTDCKTCIGVTSADEQMEIVRSHLRDVLKRWPLLLNDDIDRGIIGLVTLPDFEDVYLDTLVLGKTLSRIEYVQMQFVQREILPGGMDFSDVFIRMAPLGLSLICPYFVKTGETLDKCLIEGRDDVYAVCQGHHYGCEIFGDRAKKFVTGEKTVVLPPQTYSPPRLIISELERERREDELLREIDTFWRGDD